MLRKGFHIHALRDGRVENTRAVQVNFQPVRVRELSHLPKIVGSLVRAAAAVVRVLEADEPRRGEVRVRAAQTRLEVRKKKRAVGLIRHLPRVDPAQRGDPARLVQEGVRFVAQHHLVAALTVGEDGSQVAHRAGRDVERGFLAHPAGGHLLQAVDSGVFAVNVVADFGFRHRLAHGGRGMGDGVGTEVYEVHGVILCDW